MIPTKLFVTSNSKLSLVISSKDQLSKTMASLKEVRCALISSWSKDLLSFKDVNNIASQLIEKHCCHFVCVGENAEILHDLIDDVIMDVQEKKASPTDIVTTWFESEPIEEAVEFFVLFSGAEEGILLAILEDNFNDGLIKESLLSFAQNKS